MSSSFGREHLMMGSLMTTLNYNNLNIKLTYKASNKRFEFLDALFQANEEGFVHFEVFRKETSVNLFLHARSAHPSHLIDNILIGEFLRVRRILNTIAGSQQMLY